MQLCRYVPFSRFCEMVFNKEITLVSPNKWNDKCENYILQLIKSKQGKSELKQALLSNNVIAEKCVDELIEFIELICTTTHCLCFSMSVDEEVMWNAYNYAQQTIMWITSDNKLLSLNPNYELRLVKYDLDNTKFDVFLNLFGNQNNKPLITNSHNLFLHKRSFFAYENECRLIDTSMDNKGYDIQTKTIPCIRDFIEGVMVHPLANREFVKMVKNMCDHFELRFLGKSHIYDFQNFFEV